MCSIGFLKHSLSHDGGVVYGRHNTARPTEAPLKNFGKKHIHPVHLAYQPPASSTFLSEQTSHRQPASSTFLSEQTSTSHQPPAKQTDR
jgi:hypothetical protein